MSEQKKQNPEQNISVKERWDRVRAFEEKGERNALIKELVLIVKESKENKEKINALEKLKEIYLDEGETDRAIKCIDTMIKLEPMNDRFFREKGLILEEMEDFESAREVYIEGYESTGDKKFLSYIKDIEVISEIERDITEDENEFLPYTSGDAYKILSLFDGREGVYAKQWVSQTGDTGYSPIYEPLTPNVVLKHLDGSITIGVYQVKINNTVSFVAFDIDIKKNVYNEVITKEKEFYNYLKKCEKVVREIVNLLASKGIDCYVEFSGSKGYHVWVFLSSPISAKIAKKFCDEVLKRLHNEEGISVEAFPKQSYVKEGKLGNLIKLPFGYHLKTGKRSFFVDGEFKEIKDQRGFLHSIKGNSKNIFISAISDFEAEEIWEKSSGVSINPPEDDFDVFDVFEEKKFIPEMDEELQRVLEGCAVIKTIYSKALNSESLNAKEIGVIKYTLGCLKNGVEIVNYAFRKAGVEEEHFLKSKLNGNPTSCEKIRNKVPELASAVNCACVFDSEKFAYPTPNIYAKQNAVEETEILINIFSVEKLFERYMSLKKEKKKIEKNIKDVENKLNSLFENTGIESVRLSNGVLKRKKDENGKAKFIYEIE